MDASSASIVTTEWAVMKIAGSFLGLVLAGAQMGASGVDAASPVDATKDKTKGLPVYPGVTEPAPLPATVLCKSQSSGDFFIASGKNSKEVAGWYSAALPGFKKFSAVTGGTSQDTYFSADGTQEVTFTGRPNIPAAYLISYRSFQPGLTTADMASLITRENDLRPYLTCGNPYALRNL